MRLNITLSPIFGIETASVQTYTLISLLLLATLLVALNSIVNEMNKERIENFNKENRMLANDKSLLDESIEIEIIEDIINYLSTKIKKDRVINFDVIDFIEVNGGKSYLMENKSTINGLEVSSAICIALVNILKDKNWPNIGTYKLLEFDEVIVKYGNHIQYSIPVKIIQCFYFK